MRRIVVLTLTVVVLGLLAQAYSASAPAPPPDRVVAMYFHRTQRCPTCQKMGSYSEEAVKTGYAKEIQAGTVQFHDVDFQDKRNESIAKAYRIDGPALVVVRVAENKVAEYKNLTEMWTKVTDKPAFLKYVQDHIKAYQR